MKLSKFRELIEPFNPCYTARIWLDRRDENEDLRVTFDALKRENTYDYNSWISSWLRTRVNAVNGGGFVPVPCALVRVPSMGQIGSCDIQDYGHDVLLRFFDGQPGAQDKSPVKVKPKKKISDKFLGKHLYHWINAKDFEPCVGGRTFLRINADKKLRDVLKDASGEDMAWLIDRLTNHDFAELGDGVYSVYDLDDDERREFILDFFATIKLPQKLTRFEDDVKMGDLIEKLDGCPMHYSAVARANHDRGVEWLESWTEDSDFSEVLKSARTYEELSALAAAVGARYPAVDDYCNASSHAKTKMLRELRANIFEHALAYVNNAW